MVITCRGFGPIASATKLTGVLKISIILSWGIKILKKIYWAMKILHLKKGPFHPLPVILNDSSLKKDDWNSVTFAHHTWNVVDRR